MKIMHQARSTQEALNNYIYIYSRDVSPQTVKVGRLLIALSIGIFMVLEKIIVITDINIYGLIIKISPYQYILLTIILGVSVCYLIVLYTIRLLKDIKINETRAVEAILDAKEALLTSNYETNKALDEVEQLTNKAQKAINEFRTITSGKILEYPAGLDELTHEVMDKMNRIKQVRYMDRYIIDTFILLRRISSIQFWFVHFFPYLVVSVLSLLFCISKI